MIVLSILHGRLGNILFQVATNKFYAKEHGYESKFTFSPAPYHIKDKEDFYGENLTKILDLDMVEWGDIQKVLGNDGFVVKEQGAINYTPINVPNTTNLFILGNRQSPLYFTKEFAINLFQPDKTILSILKHRYGDLKEYTCLHIRRGDYITENQNGNTIFKIYDSGKVNKLLTKIGGKVIVISDDIEWCKKNIKYGEITYASNSIFEDFWLQTQCKNNIISNSTFSWWGAYLNQTPDRKVYYDSPWFKGVGDGDIIPQNDNWIDINTL